MIFPWRLIAKNVLIRALPPIFRATSVIFDVELPARKHYQQATSDYSGVPPTPIRSMPSFIDLHSGTPPELASGDNTPTDSRSTSPHDLVRRGSGADSFVSGSEKSVIPSVGAGRGKRRTRVDRAKYDAEGKLTMPRECSLADQTVLTKVGVYAGIGFLVTWASPLVFELVERTLGL